jgi:hypothetical protein
MRLVEGAYSSDGQLQFALICDDDKLVIQWEPFASALREMARDNDLEKDQEKRKGGKQKSNFRGPIEPPLAPAPRSPEPPTTYDEKFMRDIGIASGSESPK